MPKHKCEVCGGVMCSLVKTYPGAGEPQVSACWTCVQIADGLRGVGN